MSLYVIWPTQPKNPAYAYGEGNGTMPPSKYAPATGATELQHLQTFCIHFKYYFQKKQTF